MNNKLIFKQKFSKKNWVDASALYRTLDFSREKMSKTSIFEQEI